jgi:hypothetical protein
MILPYYLSYVENRVCLSRGVQVTGATWQTVMRIMTGVEDLVYRTEDSQAQDEYSVDRRLRGWVIVCLVRTMHKETMSVSLLVEPQN